jgi:hypothetical protein
MPLMMQRLIILVNGLALFSKKKMDLFQRNREGNGTRFLNGSVLDNPGSMYQIYENQL